MYSIRKVTTKSGATAIQIVQYIGHSSKIIKHIGSTKNEDEGSTLRQLAKDWIAEQTHQISLFPEQRQRILHVDRGECHGCSHDFISIKGFE